MHSAIDLSPSPVTKAFYLFNDTAPDKIYTLSLHDALPILRSAVPLPSTLARISFALTDGVRCRRDRKSTRLNSSHPSSSYAVFCVKKKKEVEAFVACGISGDCP